MASRSNKQAKYLQKFEIIQWNCRGFRAWKKRSHLQLYLQSLGNMPALLALQEPGLDVKFSGYSTFQGGPSSCILVNKAYTAIQVDLNLSTEQEYTMVRVLPLRRRDQSIHILNIYSPPHKPRVTFSEIFLRAIKLADKDPLVIVGDFNAPSLHWGYHYEKARGRKLAELISTLRLTLLTDPAYPTRVGNSVTRDTCPDLSLVKNAKDATWENLGDSLGSDHCLLRVTLLEKSAHKKCGQAKLTDWTQFRNQTIPPVLFSGGYAEWAQHVNNIQKRLVTTLQTNEEIPAVDTHLLHLWEARRSLTKRWKKQKTNRKLRIRIAQLTEQAAAYAAQLSDSNWIARCDAAARQMSSKGTWRLFRSLIDPSQTRGEAQKQLRRALQGYQGTPAQLADALCDRYLCRTEDPPGPAYTYSGKPNHQLDARFELHDLKAALAKMRRGTAPGLDRITVKLLANLPDTAYLHLLEYMNEIWDGRALPSEWKTSLVTFIPKAGKAVNTENLRPISLTSCAGKLMETMVRDRLSPYLEGKGFFADTMFGFRPHMSAQDVLLQLHRAVIQPITMQHNDKAILALDLKGAFDNVKHSSILANLSSTDCGAKAFAYVRDFLSKRQALLRIEDEEYGPYIMGTRGTPQGAVLSPLLFNIAMMRLPSELARVEGTQHAVYADDITIWTTEGSLGEMQERLQQAASIVEAYANDCGLQCAPNKSELLHVRAKPRDKSAIHISLSGVPIREVEELRILGLFIHHRLRPDSTIAKLKRIGEQVGRMIHRVSNKRGGLRGRDALRLAHAFVTSRILYAVPYLRTNKQEDERIDAIIRKATKRALDLPVATSNAKLRALGVLNSYQELREAHLMNQYTRLVQTAPGRRLLNRLHIQHTCTAEEAERIPELWRHMLSVAPLPSNMDKHTHESRRQARARTLERQHGSRPGVFYVDIAGPSPTGFYTASVVHREKHVNGLSFRAQNPERAEEVAIALAAADPNSKVIITDSRKACAHYLVGEISPLASQILKRALADPAPKRIVWAPGHQGLRGNEAADAAARALTHRAPHLGSYDSEANTPLLRFKEILTYYRDTHRLYPAPAKGLSKAEERTLRRLQTGTLLCPAILKHFDANTDGRCPHCGETCDIFHMVWACPKNPHLPPSPTPSREAWETALLNCSSLESQRALVRRARVGASSCGVPD